MQTRMSSFIEATCNTLLGFLMAIAVQKIFFQANNIYTTPAQDVQLVVVMTVMSIGRSYVVRRMWNNNWWKDPEQRLIVGAAFVWMIVLCIFAYKVM